jgi:hypothetical protein
MWTDKVTVSGKSRPFFVFDRLPRGPRLSHGKSTRPYSSAVFAPLDLEILFLRGQNLTEREALVERGPKRKLGASLSDQPDQICNLRFAAVRFAAVRCLAA